MIYLAFGLENDFLRYRIAVVHHGQDASLHGSQGTETAAGERCAAQGAYQRRRAANRGARAW